MAEVGATLGLVMPGNLYGRLLLDTIAVSMEFYVAWLGTRWWRLGLSIPGLWHATSGILDSGAVVRVHFLGGAGVVFPLISCIWGRPR